MRTKGDLRDYQKTAIRLIIKQHAVALFLKPGQGKCLGKGTPVLMYDGSIKPVENVCVGDLLMGDDSTPRRVLSLARGREKLYRVVPVKGDSWVCNESHILSLVFNGTSSSRRTKDAVYDISVKDYLACSTIDKNRLKQYRVGVDFDSKPVTIDPYLLGLWLGDGTANINGGFAVTSIQPEVREAMQRASAVWGLNIRQEKKPGPHDNLTTHLSGRRGFRNPIITAMKALGFNGDKFIPDLYLYNSREIRLELLAGLLDTDGHLESNCFEIAQKRQHLATQIMYLARSLGFAAYCSIKTVNDVAYYKVLISGNLSKIPNRVARKKASVRKQVKNVLRTGISLEDIGVGDYYGFTIDGNQRFLLGDFTVTHNTACVLYALTRLQPQRTLIVAPIPVCENVWRQEAQEWEGMESLEFTLIRGTPAQRKASLDAEGIHLINYDLLHWLKGEVNLHEHYQAIVFDELSLLKSPNGRRFKSVRFSIDKIPIRIGLTGTPTGNSLLGVWSQLYAVAGSANPIGRTYTQFKSRYFRQGGYMGREWLPWPDTQERILKDINGWAYSFELEREYCPLQHVSLTARLPQHLQQDYKQLAQAFMLELESGDVWAPTGGALVNKLRQFESGVIYTDDDPQELHTAKLDATQSLVEELNGDPIIIFYEYRSELKRLLQLYPGANEITPDEWNTGQHPVMLLNPRSAGHGLNLQKGGCNALFYTAPWSLELWQQAIGRIYRTGQQRSVTIYSFTGMPLEDRVIRALQNHQQIEQATFAGLTL